MKILLFVMSAIIILCIVIYTIPQDRNQSKLKYMRTTSDRVIYRDVNTGKFVTEYMDGERKETIAFPE